MYEPFTKGGNTPSHLSVQFLNKLTKSNKAKTSKKHYVASTSIAAAAALAILSKMQLQQ